LFATDKSTWAELRPYLTVEELIFKQKAFEEGNICPKER